MKGRKGAKTKGEGGGEGWKEKEKENGRGKGRKVEGEKGRRMKRKGQEGGKKGRRMERVVTTKVKGGIISIARGNVRRSRICTNLLTQN